MGGRHRSPVGGAWRKMDRIWEGGRRERRKDVGALSDTCLVHVHKGSRKKGRAVGVALMLHSWELRVRGVG